MKMMLSVVIILCLGFTSANELPDCIVRSSHPNGTAVLCRDNDDCLNPLDTCNLFPNDVIGTCCTGCTFGEPLKGAWCGGWLWRSCPLGFICVMDPFIMDSSVGQCCSRGFHEND